MFGYLGKGDLMKNRFGLLALTLFVAGCSFFVACGESASEAENSDPVPQAESSSAMGTADPAEVFSSAVVEVPQTLPCVPEEEGGFVWIETGKSYYRCESGLWTAYDVAPHKRGFDPCQFNFGAAWSTDKERDSTNYAGLDYIAVWLGDNDFYNGFEERMVKMSVEIGATPMIYAYVIAEFDKDHGIDDCNISKAEKTHCSHGAQMIREYFADSILYRYAAYANGMREQLIYRLEVDADTYESIWLIEPDFYQYSETASRQKERYDGTVQEGGGIPDSLMGVYFKQIVDTIRAYLPAAKIAIDISPWIGDKDTALFAQWYSNFDMSIVDFAGTSGGSSLATSEKIVAANSATWAKIHEVTGKPILADAGYGAGGASNGHKKPWDDVQNIKARMANGVVGIMQMNAANDFPVRADTIRPQLNYTFPWCNN